MQTNEKSLLAWSALRATPRLGPKRLAEFAITLAEQGMRGADLLGASVQDLEAVGLSRTLAEKASALLSDPPAPTLAPTGAVLLTPDDPAYPMKRLDPDLPLPVLLYAAGNIALLNGPAMGISGSRAAPRPALEFADRLATALAHRGINVVSGHAAGIDEVVHSAALKAGGTTTAVLAEGLLEYTPCPGLRDAEEESLLFMCGFSPTARWTVYQAMERNKWIAALADAVVVVSSDVQGGSWSQGKLCLDAGKTLLVPDFPGDLAPGNRRLIELGALPVDPGDVESILDQASVTAAARQVSDQRDLFG